MDALPTVCEQLKKGLDLSNKKYLVLFVDGNSKDGSKAFLENQGFWVHSQTKKGMRNAVEEGVVLLLNEGVDSITFAQPDGNCDLTKILEIINPFTNVGLELIIGSRYLPPAISYDDDLISKFGNWYFTKLISSVSKHKYYDAMVGYRTFSSKLVEKMNLIGDSKIWFPERFVPTSLGWDPIISTLSPLLNAKITEISITEPARIGGEVKKQTIKWGIGYSLQVLYVLFFLRRKMRKKLLP
jgi:hypothetical protein